MMALVAVSREAMLLKEEAETKFYPALLVYGEGCGKFSFFIRNTLEIVHVCG